MTLNNIEVSNVIKKYTNTQNAFLSKVVEIPLTEEYGVTYKPIVKIGDIVNEGDIIATSGTDLENVTYIHASLPGKVIDIVPCFAPNGKQTFAIKLLFAGSFNYLGKIKTEINPATISPSSISKILIDKGVINTFKISCPSNLGQQIKNFKGKNLVVRMFDEDPYRYADSLISKLFFNEILKTAKILAKGLNADGVVLAVDQKLENKQELREINDTEICIQEMNIKRYPCGTPREIVSAFNRSGKPQKFNFTISKKDLFTDSSTVYEAYKAIFLSEPSINKNIHFSGNCLYSSALLNIKIGTPIKDIVTQLGGFVKEPQVIIINGSLCGTAVTNLDVPVTKYVKSVEFISNQKNTDDQIYSCINCGNCRVACPVKISPDILYNNTVNFKLLPESFAASSLGCIECGLCNTVCPSRLPLCQTISVLKENLTKN